MRTIVGLMSRGVSAASHLWILQFEKKNCLKRKWWNSNLDKNIVGAAQWIFEPILRK